MLESTTGGLRVMVVDDCPDTTRSLALLVRMWGHDARVAHDGPSALELAAGWRPDVVFLDMGLPGMDGYEVARRLRGGEDYRRVLLVALSGYAAEADCRRARAAGCDCHLAKPADPAEIQRLLAAWQQAAGRCGCGA
jgi:CheY-like chemotaxis protein